ncbi:MAG: protein kinase [Myxococcaceae bacterium]|nr:protein kinase [Myxococcaceae bacterium]
MATADDDQPPDGGGTESTVARLDPVIGSEVSGYRVTNRLGVGGMGIVYEGEQPVIGKRVAIKVLRHEVADNPDVVQRLVSEARAVNKVGHRGIIDVFGFGALPDGRQCIVMEYLDGEPLEAVLRTYRTRRSVMPLYDALVILEEVLSALAAAHEAGVIHRDLKPSNIFLCKQRDGTQFVKLLDFGIAKLGVLGHTPATRASIMVGTPAYMAPEQANGGMVGPALDLYAIGCLAFELLAGRTPFEENSVVEMLVSHATKAPPHVATLNMGVPDELDALVDQLLAKNPADSPPSAEAVRREVAQLRKTLAETTGRRLSVEIEAPAPMPTLVDPPKPAARPVPKPAEPKASAKPARPRTAAQPEPDAVNETLLKPLDPELGPSEALISTAILPKSARPSSPEQRAPTAPSLAPVPAPAPVDEDGPVVAPRSKLPMIVAGLLAVAAGIGVVLAVSSGSERATSTPPPPAASAKASPPQPAVAAKSPEPEAAPAAVPNAAPPAQAPEPTPPAVAVGTAASPTPTPPPSGRADAPTTPAAAPAAAASPPPTPPPSVRADAPTTPAPAPPVAPSLAPAGRAATPAAVPAAAPSVRASVPTPAPAPSTRAASNPLVAKLQARAKKVEANLARLQASGEDVSMSRKIVGKVKQQLESPGLSRDDLESLEVALSRLEEETAP